jgi:hypothetical protein
MTTPKTAESQARTAEKGRPRGFAALKWRTDEARWSEHVAEPDAGYEAVKALTRAAAAAPVPTVQKVASDKRRRK